TPEDLAKAALLTADPDAPPVRIRAAWRDIGCSGSGPEAYRKVIYPGQSAPVWPDADRLPAQGGSRSAERRCTTYCEVPPGTIVITYSRKRGRCSFEAGVVYRSPGDPDVGKVFPCEHRTLRSRPVYEVTLPNGVKVEVAASRWR
ncbi:MAG: hypothetical protein WC683_06105, partial [bacterium]